jgi:hypothetical protein
MTTNQNQQIPRSVQLFIERRTGAPTLEVLDGFAEHASVTDEGQTMVGREAIEAWLRAASTKYTYTATVIGHTDGHLFARLEGNFPGGVADLDYSYELDETGRIARLVIE